MAFSPEDIARVREASDIVAVVGEHVGLKRVGRQHVGLCPFHAEKTPSFSINAELGVYYCHGCQAKGDVITFVRDFEHLDFVDAVERLAAKAGIEVRQDDSVRSRERQRRSRLVDAMRAAVDWYHERLLSGDDAAPARAYLRSRGYDGDLVRRFQMGWAPDDWDALARSLKLPDDVLRDTGLGFVNRRGRQQDSFRARVVFPIFDVRGDPVAFGGRILPGGDGPKYKNSPETPLYAKSRTLYALNWAKSGIVDKGEVVVCEGYTDVIGLAQVGVDRAVATCGTALTEEHVRTLRNFAPRIVLAYDADAAGQAAADRFYEWESRYELDIVVAPFAPGTDPGELARTDPDSLRDAVAKAQPFLAFRLERILSRADMRTPEGRARAAEAALGVVREHPSELVRDQYVMQVADRCHIEPDRLRARLQSPSSPPLERSAVRRRIERGGPEREALKLAVHDRSVVERLHEVLFFDGLHAEAYRALASSATVHQAIADADPEAADLLQRLAVEEPEADADGVFVRLVDEATKRTVGEYEALVRDTGDLATYNPTIQWLMQAREKLHDETTSVDAAGGLVAWLVDRVQVEA